VSQPAVRQPIPVGKYFLERGKITSDQLELALAHRAEFGLKLGQSLVELGLVTESDMVEALRYQARFPCIHLTPGIVDPRIAHKLGGVESRRLRAVAMNQVAGHTTVALEDPTDQEALEDLGHILATRIMPVYAEPSAIRKCLERLFGGGKPGPRPAASATAPASEPTPAAPAPAEAVRAEAVRAEPQKDPAPDERAVVERIRAVLQQAFEQGARSIHLEAREDGLHVRLRVGGALRDHERLPAVWAAPTVRCLKSLAKLDPAQESRPQQGSVPFLFRKQPIEVRVSTAPSRDGECAVLHIQGVERGPRDLTQLGLLEEQAAELERLLTGRQGLVVATGPAGSGRRTTLRALLGRMANPARKVVALLERCDFEVPGAMLVEVDPKSGLDYPAGARACLQQDPDLLFVQEGGQRETAQVLLEAALAGRGVFTGLRAGSALQTLSNLHSLGLESYLLAEALRGVVAQRLVRAVCQDCKAAIVPDHVLQQRLGVPADGATYFEGEGCEACHGTGYRGRLALFEVLVLTPGLRRALEKGSGPELLGRAARAEGFQDLRTCALRHARAGHTTLSEILRAIAGG